MTPSILPSILLAIDLKVPEMTLEDIKEEVSHLELAEKILLVEDIWDSIAAQNEDMPLSQWTKTELDRRYNEYKAGSEELRDWQSVHEELRSKYK